jgi:hypothetical protein
LKATKVQRLAPATLTTDIVVHIFKLVAPDASYYHSFAESHREWNGAHQDGAGLLADDDITSLEGFAAWALQEVCARLAAAGEPDRVLLTCDDANAASAKTIERCGGQLEDLREAESGRNFRRCWIDVSAKPRLINQP